MTNEVSTTVYTSFPHVTADAFTFVRSARTDSTVFILKTDNLEDLQLTAGVFKTILSSIEIKIQQLGEDTQ